LFFKFFACRQEKKMFGKWSQSHQRERDREQWGWEKKKKARRQ
jgi:hypothetical protein